MRVFLTISAFHYEAAAETINRRKKNRNKPTVGKQWKSWRTHWCNIYLLFAKSELEEEELELFLTQPSRSVSRFNLFSSPSVFLQHSSVVVAKAKSRSNSPWKSRLNLSAVEENFMKLKFNNIRLGARSFADNKT